MNKFQVPEILRINLIHTILQLKSLNINDVDNFDFIDKPQKESISKSLNDLVKLRALNHEYQLTQLGCNMA